MCYSILRLIARIEQRPNINLTPEITQVRDRAIKIWQQLQQDPYYLTKDRTKS